MLVCGNTAAMLEETRLKDHFTITGDRSVHYGTFDCGDSDGLSEEKTTSGGCC
jgi:hypothetical protein